MKNPTIGEKVWCHSGLVNPDNLNTHGVVVNIFQESHPTRSDRTITAYELRYVNSEINEIVFKRDISVIKLSNGTYSMSKGFAGRVVQKSE